MKTNYKTEKYRYSRVHLWSQLLRTQGREITESMWVSLGKIV